MRLKVMAQRKGVAFTITVFLLGLFLFAALFIVIGPAEEKFFDYAVANVVDSDYSTNVTLWHTMFTFLPAIVIFVGMVWVFTRSQKKGLGDFQQI